MGKNIIGIEKGDVLVAIGKAYIYADPNDAVLDKETDTAQADLKFGVATGITQKSKDGFSFTEMVPYYESNQTNKFDLNDTKYYVLQSTYSIEENPDYDYSLNQKKTVATVAKGIGTGFTQLIDLISGILGIVKSSKSSKTDTSGDNPDTSANTETSPTAPISWFSQNKFTLIVGGITMLIAGIIVFVMNKNKKKVQSLPNPIKTL